MLRPVLSVDGCGQVELGEELFRGAVRLCTGRGEGATRLHPSDAQHIGRRVSVTVEARTSVHNAAWKLARLVQAEVVVLRARW